MYDAIVIGARCAGASTAMLLARKGYKVLLADRARFPSDIPHGHFIHNHGPGRLHRWGLLDRGYRLPSRHVDDHGLRRLPADRQGSRGRRGGDGLRAEALGARQGPARRRRRGRGRAARRLRGRGFRDRPRADRRRPRSGQAKGCGGDGASPRHHWSRRAELPPRPGRPSPVYEATPALTSWYFSYWGDVPDSDDLEIYVRQRSIIFAFPTNHDLFAVFIAWPIEEFHAVRSAIEGHFMATLGRVPALAERVRGDRRTERFYGTADVPNFLRRPYGPGWALVGDAGCHKDPYLALDVCNALRDAEFLADTLDEGLSGRRPLDETLADYERRRNEATLAEYQRNLQLARFQPLPAEVAQLRAVLRGDQEATNRFFMAGEGMIPREAFFNPEDLQRIMAKAQAKT